MRKRVFVKLNLIWTLVFLIGFAIILFSVNPFQADTFLFIVFYLVLFCLILGILNLIAIRLRIPFWVPLLFSIAIVFILIIQGARL